MKRKQKLALNAFMALVKQAVTIICGFILPRFILSSFGSGVNGLIQSITQFLSFITFLELGIGPVIQSNLYKPLAEKDSTQISRICASSERFFRRIAAIFLAYIAVLCVVFPSFVNESYGFLFSASLILIISVSSFAQYYFGITYQLLLNADQRAYIQLSLQAGTILLNTVISILLIRLGFGIHFVKLASAAVYVIRPLVMMLYVRKNYRVDTKIKYDTEPIKQKWNGFAQHLASVVVTNTDVVVLTLFSSLENVSIYSIYYLVVHGITDAIMTLVTGLGALWGNMIAKGEWDLLHRSFGIVEWVMHTGITLLFTVSALLIAPFVSVYTKGITDANYFVPVFGMVLVAAYGVRCIRVPYFTMIEAAGHYKQTQNGSFVQMAINIVLSVALVKKFGLLGVGIGTFAAMLYHTCYFVFYLRKNILDRELRHFLRLCVSDLLQVALIVLLTRGFAMKETTYLAWIVLALKVTAVAVGITLAFNALFFRKQCMNLLKMLGGRK